MLAPPAGWEFAGDGGGEAAALDLGDVPGSYVGEAGRGVHLVPCGPGVLSSASL